MRTAAKIFAGAIVATVIWALAVVVLSAVALIAFPKAPETVIIPTHVPTFTPAATATEEILFAPLPTATSENQAVYLAYKNWPPAVSYWQNIIMAASQHYSLDPHVVAAVIFHESGGNPNAINSTSGAVGLMQIMPFSWRPPVDKLLDPDFNIWYGSAILRETLDQSEGNLAMSLGAYNCGMEGLLTDMCGKYGGWAYAESVLETCRSYGGCLG